MTATETRTDSDLILKWVDEHSSGRYSGCGRGMCRTHPGVPANHIPLAMTPALHALIAAGTVHVVEVTKPRKTDPTRTITYTYVARPMPYVIPRRNVTVSEDTRNGCTVRTVHEDGAFLCFTLYNPSGWRVGDYKTERGLTRAIARVTAA
jgi:hypothetical protein